MSRKIACSARQEPHHRLVLGAAGNSCADRCPAGPGAFQTDPQPVPTLRLVVQQDGRRVAMDDDEVDASIVVEVAGRHAASDHLPAKIGSGPIAANLLEATPARSPKEQWRLGHGAVGPGAIVDVSI